MRIEAPDYSYMRKKGRPKFCRHCQRLYGGTCPHPGAKSVHRMHIGSGACKEARMADWTREFYGKNAH